MKKILFICAMMFVFHQVLSQAPEKMSYQAVVRDSENQIISNSVVGIQIRVLQGSPDGTAVYSERHYPTSNFNGLVNIEIGTGVIDHGVFSNIDWSLGPFYLETNIDPHGGTNYTGRGLSQMMSVPYALYAKSSGSSISNPNGNAPGDMQYWDGTKWMMIPAGTTGQNLTMCNGKPTWGPCPEPPAVTLNSISDIFITHLFITASVTNAGTSAVTNKGFVWSISPNPTISDMSTNSVTGEVDFNTTLNGLSAGRTYFFRAFAESSAGIGYSNEMSATLVDDSLTFVYNGSSVTYGVLEFNNEIWLDRNLGASRIASAYNDAQSYGDLFQWGRESDSHQIRNSATTPTLATDGSQPGNASYILTSSSPNDWNNNNAWITRWTNADGSSSTSNPCPSGWRIPTNDEWSSADSFGTWNNRSDVFNSPLKLPAAGYRMNSNGALNLVGSYGYYWSSSVNESNSYSLVFYSSDSYTGINSRSKGFSVRCIKD